MRGLLFYFLQVIVCSGTLFGYYYISLRNKKFHQYNRYYLLIASTLSIIIPFLNIPVYFTVSGEQPSAIFRTLVIISSNADQPPIASVPHSTMPGFRLDRLLRLLYALVALLLIVRLLIGLSHIIRLLSRYVVEKIDRIYFINTQEPRTPFSFFRWLFWNKKIDLQSENGEQIFRHEWFHIQQKHSYDLVFIEILYAMLWINPFFLLIKRELKAVHEFLADEFATKEKDKWKYAELLLMQVLGPTNNRFVNSFFHNQIKRRIAMITSLEKTSYQYLRKVMVLPIAATVVALFAFKYEEIKSNKEAVDNNPSIKIKKLGAAVDLKWDSTKPLGHLLFVINGKIRSDIKSSGELDKILKPEDIASMSILKGDTAFAKYGQQGKNGAVEILIKHAALGQSNDTIPKLHTKAMFINTRERLIFEADTIINYPNANANKVDFEKGLVIINGRKQPPAILKEKTIISHTIILYSKDDLRTADKFGADGRYGVIVFENAKILDTPPAEYYKDILSAEDRVQHNNKIFEQVEVDPHFPGGEGAWRNFVRTNLNYSVPVEKGAETGTYTVWLQFVVDETGNISEIKPLTNHGYGMEEEAIRVLKLSPKWIPAVQNGHPVAAYKKQPITFWNGTPSISAAELKKTTVSSLLKLSPDTKVISFVVTGDLDDGNVETANNEGSQFSTATQHLLRNATAGKLITIEKILIEENGKRMQIPSLVYQVL